MKRGKVTECVLGSFCVILLQEAESHVEETMRIATERFHVQGGADQLILFQRNTFLLGGLVIEREVAGFSPQDTSGVKYVGPLT